MSEALSRGEVAARNLSEMLLIDFGVLLETLAPGKAQPAWDRGIVKRMQQAAAMLGPAKVAQLRRSPSDTVRGIACFAAMLDTSLSLDKRIARLRPFAADEHFGVREWAWMALRPYFLAEVETTIALLLPFCEEADENLRRFASEATRPRGVWCAHCNALKEDPAPGLALLEPLRSDPAKYVQDSVANWLNDAAKSQPEWVQTICRRWRRESPTAETARICKRAQRSLR